MSISVLIQYNRNFKFRKRKDVVLSWKPEKKSGFSFRVYYKP